MRYDSTSQSYRNLSPDGFLSFNIFVWAVALLCHAAANNFGALFACRAFLGICEGAIIPGFLIVTSMFYTRQEQSQRVGYWCTYAASHSRLQNDHASRPHEWLRHNPASAPWLCVPPYQVYDIHGMAVVCMSHLYCEYILTRLIG